MGDKILDVPLAQVGAKAVREGDRGGNAAGEIDIAVHSMKDVPTEFPDGWDSTASRAGRPARRCDLPRH